MINKVFYWCVDLSYWANLIGIYELINIIIFIIGYPVFVMFLLIIIYKQRIKINKLIK